MRVCANSFYSSKQFFHSIVNEWLALFEPPKILIGAGKLAKHAPRPECAIVVVRRTYENIKTKEDKKKK